MEGDFNEEVHASEGWWQEKDLKRKEEESREISSRSLKYSRSRKGVGGKPYLLYFTEALVTCSGVTSKTLKVLGFQEGVC